MMSKLLASGKKRSELIIEILIPRSAVSRIIWIKRTTALRIVDTGVTKTYSLNSLNEYTAAEGSTVSNGTEHEVASYKNVNYAYINDERLKSVTSGSNNYQLAYDALGRCVNRTLNGVTTYYIYDGEKPMVDLFPNAA